MTGTEEEKAWMFIHHVANDDLETMCFDDRNAYMQRYQAALV